MSRISMHFHRAFEWTGNALGSRTKFTSEILLENFMANSKKLSSLKYNNAN